MSANVCTVWWATPAMFRPAMTDLLTPAERDRCQALRMDLDRVRFTLATAMLRLVASKLLDCPPRAVDLRRRCPECGRAHGRPTLPGTGWWVSISHSQHRIGVAFTRQAEVGLDVERVRSIDPDELAKSVLGDDERAATARDFFVYWTRKEAVVKATADGLRVPLSEVRVSQPAEAPRLVSYPQGTIALSIVDLCTTGPYAAALAVRHAAQPYVAQYSAARLLKDWAQ